MCRLEPMIFAVHFCISNMFCAREMRHKHTVSQCSQWDSVLGPHPAVDHVTALDNNHLCVSTNSV